MLSKKQIDQMLRKGRKPSRTSARSILTNLKEVSGSRIMDYPEVSNISLTDAIMYISKLKKSFPKALKDLTAYQKKKEVCWSEINSVSVAMLGLIPGNGSVYAQPAY